MSGSAAANPREWLHHVRIAAFPLREDNAEAIVKEANDSGVFGIEVDNDITGRYESLLHPEEKLTALRTMARVAHAHGNKVFAYVAGFECISLDVTAQHTLAKDHPDWLQRDIAGKPAIFDNKSAFWIHPGEEDTWVSPYAASWRTLYMLRIRQLAATGVDGIYVDIPYWMTHFQGWDATWASFDAGTVTAFRKQYHEAPPTQTQLGDFQARPFQDWVDFRISSVTNFMRDIRAEAVSVSPNISVIPEVYPGIENEAVRVGADVYQLYSVSDAVAHEYEFGESEDHTAASRSPFDWMMYQIGMRSFQAFGEGKPTWMLNYSWDGAEHVKPAAAMRLMFLSELTAGANLWDAQGHVMSGSNDLGERLSEYHWIAKHDDIFGATRQQVGEVGVYFSDSSRNRHPSTYVNGYRGILLLLLQSHIPFQIVTPRTVSAFHGRVLVLPGVTEVSKDEVQDLERYATSSRRVVMTGGSSPLLGSLPNQQSVAGDPGTSYLAQAEAHFEQADPQTAATFLKSLGSENDGSTIQVAAARTVVADFASIHGEPHIFLANFTGVIAKSKLNPEIQHDIEVSVPAAMGLQMHVLPFLGTEEVVSGRLTGNHVVFVLPELKDGDVLSFR